MAQACRSGWLPQPWAGSLQKGYPLHQSYKKIKKAHENRFILSNPGFSGEFPSPCLLGSQKTQGMPKEAILDKNSNRENHERMFRFYWYRFGIGLPNVNGRPQICLEGLPVTCTNKKIKKACPFELDRLANPNLNPAKLKTTLEELCVKYERRTNTPVCSIEMEQSQRKLRI